MSGEQEEPKQPKAMRTCVLLSSPVHGSLLSSALAVIVIRSETMRSF